MPGASIVLLGTGLGAFSDAAGEFRLSGLPAGAYTLSVSMVGYAPRQIKNIAVIPADTVRMDVALVPAAIEMPALVVSASKRPIHIVDAPTSVSILNETDLKTQNTLSLDESLEHVPGVHMVSGQVNIRGSSGFSRGTGSRVLLLIDGFPALSADNGEIKWDAIPIDQIARVEVIKGAGSALYGTGALGGIINIITRNPSLEPETRYSLLTGLYSPPRYPQWRWATGPRAFEGIDISHSRRHGRLGILFGAGQKWANGYKENGWYRRYKANGKLQYHLSPTASLTAFLNWAFDDHGVFIQWKDRNEPLKVPIQARNDQTQSGKLNLNLAFYQLLTHRLGYRIKTHLYRTAFDNQIEGGTASKAHKFGQEVQVDFQPAPALALTLGAEWIADRVSSSADLFGNHSDLNLAAYLQSEIETGGLSLSVGGRYDRQRTDSRPFEHRISPKFGLSYRLSETTALRSALGWGFRAPSIAEIYTNASFSGVFVTPNPNLKPERSLSFEAGINRRFASSAALDLALFWSRYRDLVEARPDATGAVSFRNISKGRIAGLETGVKASWRRIGFEGSYTYMDAEENLPGGNAPLPYRPAHIATGALRPVFGRLSLEGRFSFRSAIQKASGLFPEGTRDLIAIYLVDLSATYNLDKAAITLKISNALDYNYAKVERNLGAPRRFSLGVSGRL